MDRIVNDLKLVMNLAVGAWYPQGQSRLLATLADEDSDLWMYRHYPGDCPTHEEVPYGFKPYLFNQARAKGYSHAFWLDSSCVLAKPLPWDVLDEQGYFLGLEGWKVGEWCNDQAKELLAITDEELEAPLMEGKIIGINFHSRVANEWLDAWTAAAQSGAFRGSWDNHRHDITCGAVLAHRRGMTLTPHPVTIGGPSDPPHPDSFVKAQGM